MTVAGNFSPTQDLPTHEDRVVEEAPYLEFPMTDSAFKTFVRGMEDKAKTFWNSEFNLKARQEKMRNYWAGKQLEGVRLYNWQTPYIDNMIFRNTETLISNALSRLPDIITIPANIKDQNSKDLATLLQDSLKIRLTSNEMRHKLRMSSRHLFSHLFGCIKYRWDKTIGKNGDFIFEWVHPDDLLLDHVTYLDGNPRFIVHFLEHTVKQLQAQFPSKKDELWEKFHIKLGTENQLNTVVRYKEIWFTWYKDDGTPMEGVGWMYENDLVLGKMKNPNWDYEGEDRQTGEMITNPETGVQELGSEKYYYNHLDKQEKPFIILNFLNMGKHLIDETSLIEQNIYTQDNINKRGRQITDAAATANGKWAFSSDYITKKEAEKVTDDPGEHLWGKGRIADGVFRFKAEGPSEALFVAQRDDRQIVDDAFGTHATLRGKKETDVATTSSMLREGDFTRIDDFVEEVFVRAMDRAANASVHMMKVNYTEVHYTKDSGKDGEFINIEMSQDKIEDGVVVKVKASTSDKRVQRAEAIELAKARMIDPLSLYEKTDEPNPKEMTKRLILFSTNPPAYLQEVVGEGGMPNDLINYLNKGGGGGDPQAISDLQLLIKGEMLQPPEQITEQYLAVFSNYLQSPDFENLSPDIKSNFINYVNTIKETAKSSMGTNQV